MPIAAARRRNGRRGMPGMSATSVMAAAATPSTRRSCSSWVHRSPPRPPPLSVMARVTMMPEATEIRSAGICETRPSPTESRANWLTDSLSVSPCCSTPTVMPPMRLITTMTTEAIASPFTNFDAPSIEP